MEKSNHKNSFGYMRPDNLFSSYAGKYLNIEKGEYATSGAAAAGAAVTKD
ncbi:hypothetical protein [Nitrosomonas aestuarii]|nr:hypothetical protein [Nitrosomonas aestuarii]